MVRTVSFRQISSSATTSTGRRNTNLKMGLHSTDGNGQEMYVIIAVPTYQLLLMPLPPGRAPDTSIQSLGLARSDYQAILLSKKGRRWRLSASL